MHPFISQHTLAVVIFSAWGWMSSISNAQNTQIMDEKTNPLLCNPETGLCEIPHLMGTAADSVAPVHRVKPVKLIYFTDPICSSCWGIEPQLRKLKLEYGEAVEVEYRMGGLLPDWSYNSGGISKPSDVAHHWDEVSAHYDMPIDGDLWLEDPLSSSFPPSIAFKAAQMQDETKAILFLRVLREMVFLEKKNIAKWENMAAAATRVGLDVDALKRDFDGPAKTQFEADLLLARQMGVRGFPTMFFTDTSGNRQIVYGAKPYTAFEHAVKQLAPQTFKMMYDRSLVALFERFESLTAREFAELSGTPRDKAEATLNEAVTKGYLERLTTKNGSIWRKASAN